MFPTLRFLFLLCIAAYLPGIVNATRYAATVIAADTHKPIPFATIKIPAKGIGTIADKEGRFSLEVPSATDTIVVAMAGYEEGRLCASNLPSPVLLERMATDLKEVTIKQKARHTKWIGNKTNLAINPHILTDCKQGDGIATLMPANQARMTIKKVQFNIADCTYDTVFFKVVIYERINGQLNPVPVYSTSSIHFGFRHKGKITADLSNEFVSVTHDFLVAFEVVKDMGKGHIAFCGKMGSSGCDTYTLENGHKWEHGEGDFVYDPVGISVLVAY